MIYITTEEAYDKQQEIKSAKKYWCSKNDNHKKATVSK